MVPEEGGELSKPSEDPFHAMLGKALVDLDYRDRLLDPTTRADALKEIGVADPSEDQLTAVENAKTALQTLSGSFGEGVGAA
jgi:hypothetical protein